MSDIKHTQRSFDSEMDELKVKLGEMFDKTEQQIKLMIWALNERGQALVDTIVKGDVAVNDLRDETDRMAVRLLATRQPVAVDLRRVVGSLKIATDLERIADYCVNVGKQIGLLGAAQPGPIMESVVEMAKMAQGMVADVHQGFAEMDHNAALKAVVKDDDIDGCYSALLTRLQKEMAEDPDLVESFSHLLHVARFLERLADHAVNIASHIEYMNTGQREGFLEH